MAIEDPHSPTHPLPSPTTIPTWCPPHHYQVTTRKIVGVIEDRGSYWIMWVHHTIPTLQCMTVPTYTALSLPLTCGSLMTPGLLDEVPLTSPLGAASSTATLASLAYLAYQLVPVHRYLAPLCGPTILGQWPPGLASAWTSGSATQWS